MIRNEQRLGILKRNYQSKIKREEQLNAEPDIPRESTSEVSRRKRKLTEGMRRKKEYLMAQHIKGILIAKEPSSLTEKERNSLAWANEVIANDELTRPKPDCPEGSSKDADGKEGSSEDGLEEDKQGRKGHSIHGRNSTPWEEAANRPRSSGVKHPNNAIFDRKALAGKRNRSFEDASYDPKRPRTETRPYRGIREAGGSEGNSGITRDPKVSYSEASRNPLQLAIVDFGNPHGQYSFECGKMIEAALAKATFELIRRSAVYSAPRYGKTRWYKGVLILDCKDQWSNEFAKRAFKGLQIWKGAALHAVPLEEIPRTPKARICVPDLGLDKREVLNFLQAQNPLISMLGWEIVSEEKPKDGNRGYIILLSDIPEPLRERGSIQLSFGVSEVTLKLIKRTQGTSSLNRNSWPWL